MALAGIDCHAQYGILSHPFVRTEGQLWKRRWRVCIIYLFLFIIIIYYLFYYFILNNVKI